MLDIVLQRIASSESAQNLLRHIAEKKTIMVDGYVGSMDAVLGILAAQSAYVNNRLSVIVVPDSLTYGRVLDDLTTLQDYTTHKIPILQFPEDELLPYDDREANPAFVAARQESIEQLLNNEKAILVTTVRALSKRIPGPRSVASYKIELQSGATFQFQYLVELLHEIGFEKQEIVDQPGTFAIRGGIVDVFPFAQQNPIRIEFFGDTIDSLRFFDVVNQRSLQKTDYLALYPKSESQTAQHDADLTDYWPQDTLVMLLEPEILQGALVKYWDEINDSYQRKSEAHSELLAPESRFLDAVSVMKKLNAFAGLYFARYSRNMDFDKINFAAHALESFNSHINLLKERLIAIRGQYKVFIACNNTGQAERLSELLDSDELASGVDFVIGVGELHEGFYTEDAQCVVFTDHQIFGRIKRTRSHRKFKTAQALRHIASLKPGDYVVHVDYGIARYAGLEKVTSGEHTEECLKLLYKNGDKLFVPLEHFSRVQKFSAEDGVTPTLHKLGSGDWDKVKARTKKTLKDIAQDLIKLYAERKSRKGFAFTPDTHMQYALEASFEFEDTPDQTKVTFDVKKDMESDNPMDRLVCGDVGYGKTEIAIRAAFKAVQDSKQAAILVPTTILAEQHFETFSSRMREFPVRIDVISRFRTTKEQKIILEKVQRGEIDILIGTHRLLSKDVQFKDLGLLIIDEEQRFGVAHKEKLRQLKATVDTITLTATPIPRTLHFSLMGGRDLSVINTPPQDRLPVKTEITQFDEDLIHDAVMKELDRGGQVYYVHNRIQSIDRITDMLNTVVPKARLAVIHGQMAPQQVEDIVHAFMKREYDILVATTIIENGIDIPNVNTIIIDQAHQFGLSQLYQLRGRVGRSNRQAYCYLLTMPMSVMPSDALRRLQAIEEFSDLGSGFLIAMRDLEIRGAGNMLGAEQSGFVNAVGFELYCQILDEAVQETRQEMNVVESGKKEEITQQAEYMPALQVHVFCDTYIPDTYVNVPSERVRIYKSLSDIISIDALNAIEQELVDRFGKLPVEAKNLLQMIEIKLMTLPLCAERLDIDENKLVLRFDVKRMSQSNMADRMKIRMNAIVKTFENLRFFQNKDFLDITFGFEWYDATKSRIISTESKEDSLVLISAKKIISQIIEL